MFKFKQKDGFHIHFPYVCRVMFIICKGFSSCSNYKNDEKRRKTLKVDDNDFFCSFYFFFNFLFVDIVILVSFSFIYFNSKCFCSFFLILKVFAPISVYGLSVTSTFIWHSHLSTLVVLFLMDVYTPHIRVIYKLMYVIFGERKCPQRKWYHGPIL